ncbi:MAG: carbamoyltransferase HypF [Myxococcales bacterium]|nr:carbamoyltransferase HypF [Myxococcales bacterium]
MRTAIEVSGVVQGVGFRPFVHSLASRFGLGGFVRNCTGRVVIEVEGDAPAVDAFVGELRERPPPLARIEAIAWGEVQSRGESEFHIEPSEAREGGAVFISPDVATCADCLRELDDPDDRRFRHPFINCTNCGPRLTIVAGAPYDRERTSMARFAMCEECRREYEDPRDRRFHAQPLCCPRCGPVLSVLDGRGEPIEAIDPIVHVAAALRTGRIVAIKGLGGYHLACDARNESAVGALRARKLREEKPFALMVADLAAADTLAHVSAVERELLVSAARPIVLLRRRDGAPVAGSVAPHDPLLGIMLPYTPLHHLLLREARMPLVMTSGNRCDEPIAHDDGDALERLRGIADLFLVHDRPIHTRCDDSVLRVAGGSAIFLRRSRGYAPLPLQLPVALGEPSLALGGQLKSVIALGEAKRAFLSHHLGDLDHPAAFTAWEQSIARYRDLCRIEPRLLVHDLHPDYASTRWAEAQPFPRLAVQHHHAHFASCLAENGERGPAIGVCFDGTGYGIDGTIWGGEFLVGDLGRVERAAHLLPVPMPGGEQAIRDPWRMAVSYLRAAGEPVEADGALLRAMDRGVNSPLTSSMGRLFDAAAAIVGLRRSATYEGQPAIEMEWLATGAGEEAPYPVDLDGPVIDTRPLIRALARDVREGTPTSRIARRFHATVVEMIAGTCAALRQRGAPRTVTLSGGVFMNAILLEEASRRLEGDGFRVLRHRIVPPNDGGLALGQLAAAAAME